MKPQVIVGLVVATLILCAPAEIGMLVLAIGLYVGLKTIYEIQDQ